MTSAEKLLAEVLDLELAYDPASRTLTPELIERIQAAITDEPRSAVPAEPTEEDTDAMREVLTQAHDDTLDLNGPNFEYMARKALEQARG